MCKWKYHKKNFYFIWYLQPIPYPPRGTHALLSEQCGSLTPSILTWAPKTVLARTHSPFRHVFWAHRGMHQNCDVVGVGAQNIVCSRAFICPNREHAACGYMVPLKLSPIQFPACQTQHLILQLYLWRWKWARHWVFSHLTATDGIVHCHAL